MKTLLLVRHAKSGWGDALLPDRERPLESRGEQDAVKMGRRLSQNPRRPDRIISSPAARAIATARLIAAAIESPPAAIELDERLYGATEAELVELVEGLDDSLKQVMLVGHNPGFAELANRYASTITHMPTCAIARFDFDARHWSEVGLARPVKFHFDSPKHPSA